MTRRHRGPGPLRRLITSLRVVPWWVLVAALGGIVLAVALTVLGLVNRWAAEDAVEDKVQTQVELEQTDAEKRTLAAQILAECRTGDLEGRICEDAGAATAAPPAAARPAGLSLAQVEAIVAQYLADNPPDPRPLSADELAGIVGAYLTANPPTAPPPDREQLEALTAEAVATYLEANPPPAGRDGQDAPPVTDEQIDAAVQRWFAEHPPPVPDPCPVGFEPVETAGAVGTDGTRYARAVTCVDPDSAIPPTTTTPPTTEPPTTEPTTEPTPDDPPSTG